MGRVTASRGDARSSSDRKDARAKLNKHTINKVIPALLQSNARAKKGVDAAELIIDNGSTTKHAKGTNGKAKAVQGKNGKAGRKKGRRRNEDSSEDDEGEDLNTVARADESSTSPTTTKGRESAAVASASSFSVRITQCDTLTAAQQLLSPTSTISSSTKNVKRGPNVAILNMASPLRPGGGVLNGAVAQEESLCIRTTLYPSLKEKWYRLPELGSIWTPDVCVFRDKEGKDLSKADRWYIDVISAAALRFPDVVEDISKTKLQKDQETKGEDESIHDEDEDDSNNSDNSNDNEDEDDSSASQDYSTRKRLRYASAKDRTLMISKMMAVLRTLSRKGTTSVVLGAWGCGAYGNPVSEIAKAWKAALKSTTQSGTSLKEIVFAIEEGRMAEEFAREFDEDQAVEIVRQARVKNVLELEAEYQKWRERVEMEEKVQELEKQVAQTRFPELKARLELVLDNLRVQLSDARENDEDD